MNRRNLLKSLCGCLVAPFIPINNDKKDDKSIEDVCNKILDKNPPIYFDRYINMYDYQLISTNSLLKVGDMVSYDDVGNIIKYDKMSKNKSIGYCKSSNLENKTSDIIVYRL
jgi:hypothetical protein